jgi:hypothetical protein
MRWLKKHEWLSEEKYFFTSGEAIDWLGQDVARCQNSIVYSEM